MPRLLMIMRRLQQQYNSAAAYVVYQGVTKDKCPSLVPHQLMQRQPKARQARHHLHALLTERNLARGNGTTEGRGSALVVPALR